MSDHVLKQQQQRIEEQVKEYSFQPKTNRNKFSDRRRSMQDFITDMEAFSKRKNSKIVEEQQKKKQEESKLNNSFFRARASRSPDFTKLNQLYDKGVKKQLMRSVSPEEQTIDKGAVPKINKKSQKLVRAGNISQILYEDALTRKQKMQHVRNSSFTNVCKSARSSNERVNTKYLVSKLTKELEKAYEDLHLNRREDKLNISLLTKVLINMGYLSQKVTGTENELVNLMWSVLKGDELKGIVFRNLLFFLIGINQLNVMEIFYTSNENQLDDYYKANSKITSANTSLFEADVSSIQPLSKGTTDFRSKISEIHSMKYNLVNVGIFSKNGKFFFKDFEDQNKAHRLFKLLINKKASSAKCAYYIGANPDPVDHRYSFKPTINPLPESKDNLTKELKKTHQRIRSQNIKSIQELHQKLLLSKGNQYRRRIEELRRQKEVEEMKECTFWPQTNNPVGNLSRRQSQNRDQDYDTLGSGPHPNLNHEYFKQGKVVGLESRSSSRQSFDQPENQHDVSRDSQRPNTDQGNMRGVTNTSLEEYLRHKMRPSDLTEESKTERFSSTTPKEGDRGRCNL